MSQPDPTARAREIVGPCEVPRHEDMVEWCTACRCHADGVTDRIAAALRTAEQRAEEALAAMSADKASVVLALGEERAARERAEGEVERLRRGMSDRDAEDARQEQRRADAEAERDRLREALMMLVERLERDFRHGHLPESCEVALKFADAALRGGGGE